MDHRLGFVLFCLIFRTTANMCGLNERRHYYWLSALDNLDITTPSSISQYTKKTKETCAQACNDNSSCALFSINSIQGECRLLPAFFPVPVMSFLPGVRFFYRGSENCPYYKGYTALDNPPGCYSIRWVKKTWTYAKADCERDGGHLVVLEDVVVQQRLEQVLNYFPNASEGVFIGLDDIAVEGEYVWADSRVLVNSFWAPDQPGNSTDENCVAMLTDGLHDERCDLAMYYVCQIDIP
ncbi:C-type lectin domain family 4 member M-like [Haliotis asinina]|uniref:C-type lectin domain family 4 member M-like n=1 Tax=Haliotis asinina TaxID=109174 RepID=UPI003531EC1B